jgi:hypothetical protein
VVKKGILLKHANLFTSLKCASTVSKSIQRILVVNEYALSVTNKAILLVIVTLQEADAGSVL